MYLRKDWKKDFSGQTSMKKIFKNWLVPTFIAISIFFLVQPAFAQTINVLSPDTVGVESVDGYSQVYYEEGGSRNFITQGNVNSRMPFLTSGYIAYIRDINGLGQIFLYALDSGASTQLTFLGNNLNPRVDNKGRVVWEGWSYQDSTWQIFFFDGTSVKQLTTGDTTLNPDFSGDYISYGRRDVTDTWRAVVYSIKDNKSVDITTGEKARKPGIRNGEIYLGMGEVNEEKFPLKVEDLFLLDLTSISESTSSANPILEELSATPSGIPEIPIATEPESAL